MEQLQREGGGGAAVHRQFYGSFMLAAWELSHQTRTPNGCDGPEAEPPQAGCGQEPLCRTVTIVVHQ